MWQPLNHDVRHFMIGIWITRGGGVSSIPFSFSQSIFQTCFLILSFRLRVGPPKGIYFTLGISNQHLTFFLFPQCVLRPILSWKPQTHSRDQSRSVLNHVLIQFTVFHIVSAPSHFNLNRTPCAWLPPVVSSVKFLRLNVISPSYLRAEAPNILVPTGILESSGQINICTPNNTKKNTFNFS
jgi:hypothetical protein